MLGAAAAWNHLAAEIRSTAASYGSVVSGLTGASWLGPASTSMAAAAAHHIRWLSTTATAAEQTGAQATAAASAYESAFAATVPPPVITANRSLLAALVATNVLGQNTPAITATEAQYSEMWAQDAAAMYGYAGASAPATQLTPFTAPQATTNAGGAAGQAAAVTQATATPANPSTASGLTSGLGGILAPGSNTATTGLAGLLNDLDGSNGSPIGVFLNGNVWPNFTNGLTTSGLTNPTAVIDTVTAYSYLFPAMAGGGLASNASGLAAGLGVGPAAGALGSAGFPSLGAAAVSAEMGHGASLGALSVPQSWTAIAPPVSPLASALGGTPLTAPPAIAPGMPGIPIGGVASAAHQEIYDAPMYGFRPTVMARPPAAG